MSDRGIDRLALICRLLLDQRVVALRLENEDLRLRLFWLVHTRGRLEALMRSCNLHLPDGPLCGCRSCRRTGRTLPGYELSDEHGPCRFAPWMDAIVAECGLVVGAGGARVFHNRYASVPEERPGFDADVHIYYPFGMHDIHPWSVWTYGARLLSVRSVEDPELRKLEALFARLAARA